MKLGRDRACSRSQPEYDELMRAKVIVMPKTAVLDPQGNAVRDAMRHLGMPEVHSVRIGKYMEIDIDGQTADLESRLHRLCRDLLSNPVIEDYALEKNESVGAKKMPKTQARTSTSDKSRAGTQLQNPNIRKNK